MSTVTLDNRNGLSFSFFVAPDDVSWTYHLNTKEFDTKAGRVIQLLSTYMDSITIKGVFRSADWGKAENKGRADLDFEEMQRFEDFFLKAVRWQQDTGRPLRMDYPFIFGSSGVLVYLKSFPSISYATDVVIPEYSVTLIPSEPHHLNINVLDPNDPDDQAKTETLRKMLEGVGWKPTKFNDYTLDDAGLQQSASELAAEFAAHSGAVAQEFADITGASGGVSAAQSTASSNRASNNAGRLDRMDRGAAGLPIGSGVSWNSSNGVEVTTQRPTGRPLEG